MNRHLSLSYICVCIVQYTHGFTRVITEVDFGESNIYEQVLHTDNPAFIAVFILSHDGDLRLANTLDSDNTRKNTMK